MNRIFFYFVLCALIFASCTRDTGTNPKDNENESFLGWKSAGFVPDKATLNTQGGGLQQIVHSGNWIVLMDAWTSPVADMPGYFTYTPRLFISKVGSDVWDTLKVPTAGNIKSLYANSSGFYIGTYVTAELWKYAPDEKKWENTNLVHLKKGEGFNIYGISEYQGKLIVSMAGFKDSTNKEVISFVKLQSDSGWIDLDTPPIQYSAYSDSLTVPLQFHKGVEWNNRFYAATTDGVWYLNSGSSAWTQLPTLPKVKWTAALVRNTIQDIVIHRDHLYVVDGEAELVYEWNESGQNWNMIDSLYLNFHLDSTYTIYTNTPGTIETLVSDGKHLFVSGKPAMPQVYMGDYGEPYGNIPKGWRDLKDGWCTEYKCVSTATLYSLDVIGDTLYAAAWEGLFKFPLADLDSVIADESDFFGMAVK
ncbi:MAG: hypothetical protein Q4F84_02915 [Fibrobacter sp.]|nr:hypothetical protein [Fibrobacter sp.]